MTAEDFFNNNWDKCLSIVHKDCRNIVVMVYDPNLLRTIKLNSLSGKKTIFKKSEQTEILFVIDYDINYLLVDEDIWLKLEDDYNISSMDDFIRNLMLYKSNNNYKNIELNQLIPSPSTIRMTIKYDDDWELLNL